MAPSPVVLSLVCRPIPRSQPAARRWVRRVATEGSLGLTLVMEEKRQRRSSSLVGVEALGYGVEKVGRGLGETELLLLAVGRGPTGEEDLIVRDRQRPHRRTEGRPLLPGCIFKTGDLPGSDSRKADQDTSRPYR